jgi:hypothetical protein
MNQSTLVHEQFKVVNVSNNTNSFGLYGVVILAKSGKAFEIGVGSLYKPKAGQMLNATLTESGNLDNIEGISYEIPRMLEDAPQYVVDEVYKTIN